MDLAGMAAATDVDGLCAADGCREDIEGNAVATVCLYGCGTRANCHSNPPPIQQQREDHDLGAADLLRPALAVVPRQHQDDDKTDCEREDQQLFDLVRPRKALRDDIQHLDQRERRCDVRERPLHQLALLQAGENSAGANIAHGIALASVVVGRPTFLQNATKRGSLR